MLYERMDKPKAKESYLEKLKNSPFQGLNTIKPETAWYRKIFE